jgi:hypothetical protein
MPPSTLGISQNLHDMATAITFDIMPLWQLARAVPWIAVLAICGGLAAVVAVAALLGQPPGSSKRRAGAMISVYFCLGVAMIVYARTRYQWGGGPINIRHASHYDWLLVPSAAVLLDRVQSMIRVSPALLLCAVTSVIICLRAYEIGSRLYTFQRTEPALERIVATGEGAPPAELLLRQVFLAYGRIKPLGEFVRSVSPECRLVSNLFNLLRALYDVPVTGPQYWQRPVQPEPTVVIIASPDLDPATNSDLFIGMKPIVPANMPPGIHIFSDQPERCVRAAAG